MKFTDKQFRDVMGRFATGVCVITAAPEGFDPIGVTINSFTAVSIDPPLVLWCLKTDSVVYPVFEESDHFTVNVLGSDQESLSEQYADRARHQLETGTYVMDETGCPSFTNAISSFRCIIRQRYAGGDHVIILGEVEKMTTNPGEPLVFYNSSYRELKP